MNPIPPALRDDVVISDDPKRLDLDLIHRFLAEQSYWARGRTRSAVERAIGGSLCLGAYGPAGQLGFARAVTDRAVFAWMSDVFVLPAARGRGSAVPSSPPCSITPSLPRSTAGCW